MDNLKRTPLFQKYQEWNAKTIDFGGWELPVQFTSIKAEHEAVRTKAGLFDVSHMGEILVTGETSLSFLQQMMTNDLSKLKIGRAQYNIMCNEAGGTIDDLLIYHLEENVYLLVVNAANSHKDYEWLMKHQIDGVTIQNVSNEYALLAIQGPKAEEVLQNLACENSLVEIGFFQFKQMKLGKVTAIVSRTGYTGEDGFEIYCNSKDAVYLWDEILSAGESAGLVPCGLGARDTLRFEACLPLYGQELSESISPLEAGLSFAVKTAKEANFIGKEALIEQKNNGVKRKLIGIEMIDKGIPRHGYEVFVNDDKIGFVTSGTQSPTLKKNIGLALVDASYANVGNELTIKVRAKQLKAKVVPTPFYKRK
ncbi:glycine cleavage system aminomethyltransferase GcvT [Bacillus kwashiorkori]|uniref:glycine cleavage system aminomethyltransferase GcvT n=1 Tax=Bacillus kwashiorkori TaxID=1522318 RepID=UPI000784E592|nr:glycine cleavage system aminomethyltransferase GcvT [Bacillus kwashiorkori]